MFKIHYAKSLSEAGTVASLSASAGKLDKVEAMAVRGFSAGTAKLVWVKALDIFLASGELVRAGDYLQLTDGEAANLVNRLMAKFATEAEVLEAQAS